MGGLVGERKRGEIWGNSAGRRLVQVRTGGFEAKMLGI